MKKKFNAVEWVREIRDREYEKTKNMTPREFAEYEDAKSRRFEEESVWRHAIQERLDAEDEAAGTPGADADCTPAERSKRTDRMRKRMEREMKRMMPEEQRKRLEALSLRYTERLGRQPVFLTPEERQDLFRATMDFQESMLALRAEREAPHRPQPAPHTGAAQPLAGAAGEA